MNNLLSVCIIHPKKANLSRLISRLPKGTQIVSCAVEQRDEYENQFEVIANTPSIVSIHYYYQDYGIDFDFAQIRNKMDELASGDWSLHIDSDEYLGTFPEDAIAEIQAIDEAGAVGGWITISGLMYDTSHEDRVRERYSLHAGRLHKKNSGLFWEGICHEALVSNDETTAFVDTDIVLIHDGYKIDSDGFEDKGTRNGKLLIREYTRKPSKRAWNYLIKTFSTLKAKE
jgi:hypothetical protein